MAQENIYNLAKQLGQEIQQSEAFNSLKKALDEVRADPQANAAFEGFREAQQDIQALQEEGQQPTPEKIEKWQAAATTAQGVKQIESLSVAEQSINAILQEVNDLITDPLNQLYR